MKKIILFVMCFILSGCSKTEIQSDKEKIKIGVVTKMEYAEYDKSLINGINSAIVESFSNKYEYETVFVQSDDIQKTYRDMESDGIKYVIGDLSCQKDESGNLTVVSPVKYVDGTVNIALSYEQQGKYIADFADRDDMKTSAIIYNSDIDYSRELAKSFEANYKGQIKIVKTFSNSTTDFTDILTQVKEFNPDIIFIPEYYPNVNKIYEQCKNLRITSVFLGGDGWESVKTDEQDSKNIKGGYFFSQYSSDISSPLSSAFANQYLKIYGKNPDTYSALGYDAVKWIINDNETPDLSYDGLTIANDTPKGVINYVEYDGYVMYEEVKE